MYQIEVLYPQRVQGVGNDFDFQFGDTARYRDVDGCGVGERLVRPYRDFMRGVDVLAATVKVNGQVATTHEGGFSIFRADVTDLCHEGDNELTIEVSNEDTPSMYPASADFTFYGGLYRGVNLISVPGTHFDLDYFGGPGIKVTPKPTEDGGATF